MEFGCVGVLHAAVEDCQNLRDVLASGANDEDASEPIFILPVSFGQDKLCG